MSNKHVNHQHGLTTMNASRPKSKIRKRLNKEKAKIRKLPLLEALFTAKGKTAKNKETKKTNETSQKKSEKKSPVKKKTAKA